MKSGDGCHDILIQMCFRLDTTVNFRQQCRPGVTLFGTAISRYFRAPGPLSCWRRSICNAKVHLSAVRGRFQVKGWIPAASSSLPEWCRAGAGPTTEVHGTTPHRTRRLL
jgi:hypothetical protein